MTISTIDNACPVSMMLATTRTIRPMIATGPVALIEPQMAVNNFYDKHASRVHDKYREQEVHLKRLNRIQ